MWGQALALLVMGTVPVATMAMAAMHEQVHQRAHQEDKIRESSKRVGCVLHQEIESRHQQKTVEDKPRSAPW